MKLLGGCRRDHKSVTSVQGEVLSDYFDGELFRRLNSETMNKWVESEDIIVFLTMSSDGFEVFRDRKGAKDSWPVAFLSLTLNPNIDSELQTPYSPHLSLEVTIPSFSIHSWSHLSKTSGSWRPVSTLDAAMDKTEDCVHTYCSLPPIGRVPESSWASVVTMPSSHTASARNPPHLSRNIVTTISYQTDTNFTSSRLARRKWFLDCYGAALSTQ